MNSAADLALVSWNLDPSIIALLLIIAFLYVRGWLRGRQLIRDRNDPERLLAFLAGLSVLFLAGESPLDTFDALYLSAHMAQHLLLMMIAPPLILLGHPMLPLLRGLPKKFVKEGLGPFLSWPLLKKFLAWLTSPAVAWVAFAASTILWHLPYFYELALRNPRWHELQHASFFWTGILFWWPIIRPGPGKSKWPEWIGIPYLLFADIVNTALSAFLIFSGRVLYPTYETVRAGGLRAQDDQTLAGAIMWVPGSVVYLVPAIVIAMRLLSSTRSTRPAPVIVKREPRSMKFRLNLPRWRRLAQVAMLLLAIVVMGDGFFGSQIAPLNLAGVLPWIHWRALSIIALLLVGNLFCMACPFTLVRDLGRRVLPAKLRWPRALRSKWLSIALLVLFFWAYEAFSLWNSPWLTAWLIAGYFAAALLIDGFFRGASFCKYVCPIGQFHFITSLISPREIAVRNHQICESCRTYDCIRGNSQARGCELYLFQPKKASNLDCTFCLDCIKACPHDNVALISVVPAATLATDPYRSSIGRLSRRADVAALALVIVFAAFVSAAAMTSSAMPWERYMIPLIAVPAIAISVIGNVTRRFVFALVPLGVGMWAAHMLFHLITSWSGAGSFPNWLTPLQLLTLDAGLLLSLYTCWRIGKNVVACAPWAVLSCTLYALGAWILFQPMQMRGMLH